MLDEWLPSLPSLEAQTSILVGASLKDFVENLKQSLLIGYPKKNHKPHKIYNQSRFANTSPALDKNTKLLTIFAPDTGHNKLSIWALFVYFYVPWYRTIIKGASKPFGYGAAIVSYVLQSNWSRIARCRHMIGSTIMCHGRLHRTIEGLD